MLIVAALCATTGCHSANEQQAAARPASESTQRGCGPSSSGEPHHVEGDCSAQELSAPDGMAEGATAGVAPGLADVDRKQPDSTSDLGLARRIGK
ncbi:MAG TPA: hypothetical protein VLQ93_01375, partial [Myxococcaceae bacterium]|nr:hypothetical protein [Myxococcaceae bacterium]